LLSHTAELDSSPVRREDKEEEGKKDLRKIKEGMELRYIKS